jgi:putative ABC transport system permease protein
MDAAVVAFTLALALAVGVLVSFVPVINLRQANLSQAFREETRSGTSGRATRLLRQGLVASQVAFAFMLLIGAGLLLASFQRVLAIEPGFEPRGVLTARIALPNSRYAGAPELRAFAGRLLEGIRSVPFVRHAGLTSSIPFGDDYSDSVIIAEGYQMAPGESLISPYRVRVSPGYFEAGDRAARRPSLHGGDSETAPAVVIVDEKLARKFWGDTNPVGRRCSSPTT